MDLSACNCTGVNAVRAEGSALDERDDVACMVAITGDCCITESKRDTRQACSTCYSDNRGVITVLTEIAARNGFKAVDAVDGTGPTADDEGVAGNGR